MAMLSLPTMRSISSLPMSALVLLLSLAISFSHFTSLPHVVYAMRLDFDLSLIDDHAQLAAQMSASSRSPRPVHGASFQSAHTQHPFVFDPVLSTPPTDTAASHQEPTRALIPTGEEITAYIDELLAKRSTPTLSATSSRTTSASPLPMTPASHNEGAEAYARLSKTAPSLPGILFILSYRKSNDDSLVVSEMSFFAGLSAPPPPQKHNLSSLRTRRKEGAEAYARIAKHAPSGIPISSVT